MATVLQQRPRSFPSPEAAVHWARRYGKQPHPSPNQTLHVVCICMLVLHLGWDRLSGYLALAGKTCQYDFDDCIAVSFFHLHWPASSLCWKAFQLFLLCMHARISVLLFGPLRARWSACYDSTAELGQQGSFISLSLFGPSCLEHVPCALLPMMVSKMYALSMAVSSQLAVLPDCKHNVHTDRRTVRLCLLGSTWENINTTGWAVKALASLKYYLRHNVRTSSCTTTLIGFVGSRAFKVLRTVACCRHVKRHRSGMYLHSFLLGPTARDS